MNENEQKEMIEWCKKRIDRHTKEVCDAFQAVIAANMYHKDAVSDLDGIECGRPTRACQDRWYDYKSRLPKPRSPQLLRSEMK